MSDQEKTLRIANRLRQIADILSKEEASTKEETRRGVTALIGELFIMLSQIK